MSSPVPPASAPHNHEGNSPSSLPDGSNLDTTLLESLFYNEMLMLDDSSDLLTSVTGGVTSTTGGSEAAPAVPVTTGGGTAEAAPVQEGESTPEHVSASTDNLVSPTPVTGESGGAPVNSDPNAAHPEDPFTFAEQSLFRDFGVSEAPIPHISDAQSGQPQNGRHPPPAHGQQPPPHYQQPPNHSATPYHPHPQSYPGHYQQHPGAPHYPPNAHPPQQHPPPQHQHYQHSSQQPHILPRSSTTQTRKGIKHSVVPKQSAPAGGTQAPAPPPQPQVSHPPHHHPQQPPHHPLAYNPHAQHPQPSQTHPHHQPPPNYHQPPHHNQHHYPPHHYQPKAGHMPSLVPVPAPAPHHPHHHSAFGAPPNMVSAQHSPHSAQSTHTSPFSSPEGTTPMATSVPAHPPLPLGSQGTYSRPHLPHHQNHYSAHPQAHHHPQHAHPHAHTQPPKDQLVSQFATLANRLGINLPPNLLSSLTKSAGKASAETGKKEASKGEKKKGKAKAAKAEDSDSGGSGDESTVTEPAGVASSTSSCNIADLVRKSAEEAFDAVTRKRSRDDAMGGRSPSRMSKSSGAGSDGGSDTNRDQGGSSKSAYAKRRKKPRMEDCEQRLAKLKAENEKLKRHLDNVTNRTEKFEQDRVKAEETMKQMLETDDVSDEELDKVIRDYSEAYSDYGKRRHEELSFHLEQLQKLANPTNFTKMGLWTIAKANDSKDPSKQNPLIGILQKELNISSQQTRKILDQRQKIRDLCHNLNATFSLLEKLKDLCEQKNKTFNDRLNKTREILTPRQVVKLIMWIKNYSDVLGTICPGWTSEQLVKRPKAAAPKNSSLETSKTALKTDEAKPGESTSEPTTGTTTKE